MGERRSREILTGRAFVSREVVINARETIVEL